MILFMFSSTRFLWLKKVLSLRCWLLSLNSFWQTGHLWAHLSTQVAQTEWRQGRILLLELRVSRHWGHLRHSSKSVYLCFNSRSSGVSITGAGTGSGLTSAALPLTLFFFCLQGQLLFSFFFFFFVKWETNGSHLVWGLAEMSNWKLGFVPSCVWAWEEELKNEAENGSFLSFFSFVFHFTTDPSSSQFFRSPPFLHLLLSSITCQTNECVPKPFCKFKSILLMSLWREKRKQERKRRWSANYSSSSSSNSSW